MADRELTVQIGQILSDYSKEVRDTAEKVINDVAKETAARLRQSSPQNSDEYAAGWTKRKDKDSVIVYNRTKPMLTHLLEYGHVERNQYGTWGRVRSYPHIKAAEEWANNTVLDRLIKELGK